MDAGIIQVRCMSHNSEKIVVNKKEYDSQDTFVIEELQQSLKDLAFGEIVITVHDSRVVQIEKREKKRFPQTKHGDCKSRAQKD